VPGAISSNPSVIARRCSSDEAISRYEKTATPYRLAVTLVLGRCEEALAAANREPVDKANCTQKQKNTYLIKLLILLIAAMREL
jgi:hypothetical protein